MAQTPPTDETADARVAQALDALGLPYRVAKGFYAVRIEFRDDDRAQFVFITSRTAGWRGRHWRQVFSEAYRVDGPLPWDKALWLLGDSDTKAFGTWSIDEEDGQTVVNYQASVPDDAWPAELHDAIMMVADVADSLEKTVLGTDEH